MGSYLEWSANKQEIIFSEHEELEKIDSFLTRSFKKIWETKEKELLLNAQQKSLSILEEVKREETTRRRDLKEEQQKNKLSKFQ